MLHLEELNNEVDELMDLLEIPSGSPKRLAAEKFMDNSMRRNIKESLTRNIDEIDQLINNDKEELVKIQSDKAAGQSMRRRRIRDKELTR